jgi:murein L,D-transpeptidase YafK
MHISYPNAADLARAKAAGVKPGGMIMLHGTPLDEEYPEWFFHTLDWTEGCIALKNDDMRELWKYVRDGTLIEIRP